MNDNYGRYLAFPFHVAPDGRTAQPQDRTQHIKEEMIQLILTNVGERLFQPQFGTSVSRLVFENLDETTAAITKATLSRAISRWLGDRVAVEELVVERDQTELTVDVRYRVAGTEDSRVMRFQRSTD